MPPGGGNVTQPEEPRPVGIGRRDPFRPFTLNARPVVRRRENLSPLERYELAQLKLVGIIWNTTGNGKVKAIRQNEIIIEESFVDLYGDKKRREVGMRILAESAE
jgi:Tfp pilus assembly protein PilP